MTQNLIKTTYGEALLLGFEHLLRNDPKVFCIGQGLWAKWYVGNSMRDLDKQFGRERIIDSPVSELACTGAALGAALSGYRPIVIHPRIDFMLLAVDQIVTQAANWSSMFGGQHAAPVTVRGIINRGGEQGAQHSQALHSWFAHVPGLRVVMPATVQDARDLLVASVLCDDPVLFIDDRWCYDAEDTIQNFNQLPPQTLSLREQGPKILRKGDDITLVGASYTSLLALDAARALSGEGISAEVIDLRVINPLELSKVFASVTKTGRLCVIDSGFSPCGLAGEVIAQTVENITLSTLKNTPKRITLPYTPAPTSRTLEDKYFIKNKDIIQSVLSMFNR